MALLRKWTENIDSKGNHANVMFVSFLTIYLNNVKHWLLPRFCKLNLNFDRFVSYYAFESKGTVSYQVIEILILPVQSYQIKPRHVAHVMDGGLTSLDTRLGTISEDKIRPPH